MTKAYNELVSLLLTEEDRLKFEWVVGAVLSGEDSHILIVHGDAGSGKSTLLNIARQIFMVGDRDNRASRVVFQHDGYSGLDTFYPETNVFSANNQPVYIPEGAEIITTTGDRVSVNKHYVLMKQIYDEAPAVAVHCIGVYNRGKN